MALAPILGWLDAPVRHEHAQRWARRHDAERVDFTVAGRHGALVSRRVVRSAGLLLCVDGHLLLDDGRRHLDGEAAAHHLARRWQESDGDIEHVFGTLGGNFAVALVDPVRGAWLVRDAGGGKPLFRSEVGEGAVFGSSAVGVARTAFDAPRARLDAQGSNVIVDVAAVEVGFARRLDQSAVRDLRVPRFGQGVRTVQDGAVELRELLKRALAAQPREHLGVAMSGGLDSSALAAALCDERQRPPPPAYCFSHESDDLPAAFHERGFAQAAADRLGIPLTLVSIAPGELVTLLHDTCAAQDAPFGSPAVMAQARLFATAAQSGTRTLVGGHGPDSLLGGGTSHLIARAADLLRAGNVVAASRLLAGGRNFHATPAPRLVLAALGMTARRADGSRLADTVASQLYGSIVPIALLREECNARAAGLDSVLPYLSRGVLTRCAALAPTAIVPPDGETKAVLRRAFVERLPARIVQRKRAVGFAVPALPWLRALPDWRERLRATAGCGGDPASLAAIEQAIGRGGPRAWPAAFDAWQRLIAAEWLACHAMRVA